MPDTKSLESAPIGAIEFREGTRATLLGNDRLSTRQIVELALNGSMALQGKPVRCTGVVPGVTMSVSTGRRYPSDGEEAEMFATDIWTKIEPKLAAWLKMRTPPAGITLEYGDNAFLFCCDGRQSVSPGAMEIEVLHDVAAVRRYQKDRQRKPLVIAKSSPAPQTQAPGSTMHDGGEHHQVRGHWRRPHFRMQPHGPHSSLRKVAFIGPTIVRPDRLGLLGR